MNQTEGVARSYKFRGNKDGDFPITASDSTLEGLGCNFAVDTLGQLIWSASCEPKAKEHWESYVEQKTANLKNLCSLTQLIN
ncbi:hypothetical protein [Legionella sp.]|uniref:hypothetical protein n=1 Tax=Legionella sp. TaxID=459 RepID=UPI003CC5FA2E